MKAFVVRFEKSDGKFGFEYCPSAEDYQKLISAFWCRFPNGKLQVRTVGRSKKEIELVIEKAHFYYFTIKHLNGALTDEMLFDFIHIVRGEKNA